MNLHLKRKEILMIACGFTCCAVLLIIAFFYNQEQKAAIDAITSASGKEYMDLPSESDTYKVIGKVRGIKNYIIKYDENLFRGGDILAEEGMALLKSKQIKTIIAVTPTDLERDLAEKYNIKLVEVPYDYEGVPKDVMNTFLNSMRNDAGPFFLHCHGGGQRAGTLAAAYRIHIQKWDFNKAVVEFGMLGGKLKKSHKLWQSIRTI